VGCARIGAFHKRNSHSTWGSSSSCTTSASEAKRCCLRSWSYWSRKTLESNKSVATKPDKLSDPLLEAEDMPLHFLPRDTLPGHPQELSLCFGSSPLTHGFTFQDTGPTSAYPGHYPWPLLLRASSSPVACGWHLLCEETGLTESHWRLLRSQFP